MTSNGEVAALKNTGLFNLLALIGVLALASIASFKNRKLQASITSFNFAAIMLLFIMMYFYSYRMDYFETNAGSLSWQTAIPVFLLLINYLGLRGIRKDARIIRSMDRFR